MRKQRGEITVLAAVILGVTLPFLINPIVGIFKDDSKQCQYSKVVDDGNVFVWNDCGLTIEEAFKDD